MIDKYSIDKQGYKKNTTELHREKTEKTEKIYDRTQVLSSENKKKGENGHSNTVSFHPSTFENYPSKRGPIPLWELDATGFPKLKNTVNVFCDYLKFFTANCELTYRGIVMIEELFLKGKLFLDENGCKGKKEFEITKSEAGGQVHNGSKKTWSYKIENSIGVTLYVSDNGTYVDALNLEFKGSPLKHLIARNNFLSLCEIIKIMKDIVPAINVSKFHATVEVSHDLIDILQLKKCLEIGDFHGASVRHTIPDYRDIKIGDKTYNTLSGLSLYFGSKKTRAKRINIYETYEKHGYHAVRYELRLGDFQSRNFVNNIMKIYDEDSDKMLENSIINHPVRTIKLTKNNQLREYFINYIFSLNTLCFIDKPKKKANRGIFKQTEIILPFWRKFRDSLVTKEFVIKFDRSKASISRKFRYLWRNSMGLLRSIKDKFGESAMIQTILDGVKLSELKESERFKDDVHFKTLTGKSLSYQKNLQQLNDLGDKCWLGLLEPDIREALRKANLLHHYPKMFNTGENVIFPIFKNCNPEFHELVSIPF